MRRRTSDLLVRSNFRSLPLLFPLSPSVGNVQTHNVLFSLEDPMWPIAFGPIFLLDPVFSLLYTLRIKKQLLIKTHQYE